MNSFLYTFDVHFYSRYAGRVTASSPATGNKKQHIDEQAFVIEGALQLS